ncbi:MAG: phage major capsid protein [Clostridia bacterium]|nr:phage major capsid protein [Clostridia bacterium]
MNEKLKRILKRKAEIRAKLSANVEGTIELTDEEIEKLQGELENLNKEEEAAVEETEDEEKRRKAEAMTRAANGKQSEVTLRMIERPGEEAEGEETKREMTLKEKRERGAALKEKRAITVGNSQIATPKHTAKGVTDTFNQVSTLVDLVTITPLNGGESYERGYVKNYGEGGATDENGNYKQVETEYDYAEIKKQKVTAYQEEPEEITRLADEDYHDKTVNGTTIAVKKKMSKDILIGDGSKGRLQGIFTNPEKFAIDKNTDIEISEIDNTTLNKIIFAYGGEEDVVNDACMIMNKNDLQGFANVRTTDGKAFYDIELNGNTGKINKIPFVLNSAANSIMNPATKEGDYCMAYGSLSNYEIALFSDLEIKQSEDYKFKEGQIAHRGSVFAGGNVVAHNGFVRVKKAAATTAGEI